jgi:hypothetical protein
VRAKAGSNMRATLAIDDRPCELDGWMDRKCEQAATVAAEFDVARAAALVDSMRSLHVRLPHGYGMEFPVVFDNADSGLFKADR